VNSGFYISFNNFFHPNCIRVYNTYTMKKTIFISAGLVIMLLLAAQRGIAQIILKGRAYSQAFLPGTIPVITDEQGNTKERKIEIPVSYYIYIETGKSRKIEVTDIFINGVAYTVSTERIKKTPVVITDLSEPGKPQRYTVVKKTNNQVLQIKPIEKKLINKPVVFIGKVEIRYKYNKKSYNYSIKTIKELPPVQAQ
jgi:hypothetical protein